MKFLIKIASYVIICIFFLSILVLQGGFRSGNVLFIQIGGIVLLIFAIIIGIVNLKERQAERIRQKEYETALRLFKKQSHTSIVDLTKVKIKSNHWTEEHIISESKYSGLDPYFGDGNSNIEQISRELNTMEFNIPVDGKNLKYTTSIAMNLERLKIHLAIQKTTILYYDKDNTYLDLDFLNQ